MIERIRIFLKSEFAKALSTSSATTAMQMLSGIVLNKILAITVGPAGLALLGQFANFKEMITSLANGAFSQGVTKYIADKDINNEYVISTSYIFSLLLSFILCLILIIFSKSISSSLFKTIEYQYIVIIFSVLLPLFTLNNLLLSVVNGYREYFVLTKLKSINSLITLVISGLLAWFLYLEGALLALAINTSIVFLLSYLIIYKNKEKYINLNLKFFNYQILKKLFVFSLMAIISTQLKPIVQLIIRDYIINHSGDIDAGIWEATKRLSSYYTQVITVALGVYYLPKLSSLVTNQDLKKEIFRGVKIIMPVFIFIGMFIFSIRGYVITILFSAEFEPMNSLILPQLIGDAFMLFSFMIAYLMIAKAMAKVFIISQIVFSAIRLLISIYLFNYMGIEGVIWANAINYLFYSLFVITYFRNILFKN